MTRIYFPRSSCEKKDFTGRSYVEVRTKIHKWLEKEPHIQVVNIERFVSLPNKPGPKTFTWWVKFRRLR